MTSRSQLRLARLTLALTVPVMLAILVVFLRAAGEDPLPGGGAYRVQAVVPTSVALAPRADVRIAGANVGHVEDIRERGSDTLLLLTLEPKHSPIFRDAQIEVRLRTLVGENYVELSRGTPAAGPLPDNGIVAVGAARESVQVDQVLSTFDRRTRRNLRRVLDELGGGLAHHGRDLNAFFGQASALTDEASPILQTLSDERRHVATLVDDLGRVMRSLGERREDIRLLARRSRGAVIAFADRDVALARTLEEIAPTLDQAGSTTARLARFSGEATPVIRDLRLALGDLQPLVDDLRPAARSTRATMAALDRFTGPGTRMLGSLERFSDRGADAAPSLNELLREYATLASDLGPYSREFGAFFANLRSATNAHDATGNLARLSPLVSPSIYAGFTPEMEQVYERLRDMGTLQALIGDRGENPYPAPGTIGDPAQAAASRSRRGSEDARTPRR